MTAVNLSDDLIVMARNGATLFVEYLVNVEGWSYSKIEEITDISESQFVNGKIDKNTAMVILIKFARKEPMLIERFDSYYNFSKRRYDINKLEKIAHKERWIKKWK